MKRIFKLVSYYLAFVFVFAMEIVGFSYVSSNNYWREAQAIHYHLNTTNNNYVLMTSKSEAYPRMNAIGSITSYLGYKLTSYGYAHSQLTYVAAVKDENTTPFKLVNNEDELVTPFIAFNGYNANEYFFASNYFEPMFGNDMKSVDMELNDVYISKNIADTLIKGTDLTYESLVGTKINSKQVKEGVESIVELTIIDIIEKYNYGCFEAIYGKDIVFGSYKATQNNVLDNMCVHSAIIDDIYANSYFLEHTDTLIIQGCHYSKSYSRIENGSLVDNEDMSLMLEEINKHSGALDWMNMAICVILASLGIYLLLIYKKSLEFTHNENKFSILGYSISFALATLLCRFVGAYRGQFVFFSPIGFVVSLSITAIIVIAFYLYNRRIDKYKI